MKRDAAQLQTRTIISAFTARRAEGDNGIRTIEAYFALHGVETELWPGCYEEIGPGAFNETLGNDIRALTNHDTTLVLGRNKANTLDLRVDAKGLWGVIRINENDSDAVNLYERVARGDVDQCSFGFNILEEEVDWRDDGTVKFTVTKIDLHEVSICTFPAYKDTTAEARMEMTPTRAKALEEHRAKEIQTRKEKLKERIHKLCSDN